MYTKTKLRRRQDINKFEEIYKGIEKIYEDEFIKKINRHNRLFWLLMVTSFIVFIVALLQSSSGSLNITYIIIGAAMFLIAIIVAIVTSPDQKYIENNCNKRIIETLVNKMYPTLNYSYVATSQKEILNNYQSAGFVNKGRNTNGN